MTTYRNPDSKKTEKVVIWLSEEHYKEFEALTKEKNTSRAVVVEKYIDNLRLPKEPKQASELNTKFTELEDKKLIIKTTKRRIDKLNKYAELWGISLEDTKRVIAKYIVQVLEDYKRGIKPR